MPEIVETERLVSELVAVLLVAGEGAERRALQQALELSPAQLDRVIQASEGMVPGLLVQEHGSQVRLVTHPDTAASVRRFTQTPSALRLSGAAIETLAVIAYSQPTTRTQVQEARGVNSDAAVATLMQHGLIEESGRAETPGRPTLFSLTADCLSLLGLGSLRDLPDLTDGRAAESDAPLNGRGAIVELRALKTIVSV